MNFDKETMKKIREIIVFTVIVIMAFWKYEILFGLLRFLLDLLLPFLIGGAMAFALNVPMLFFEKRLFPEKKRGKIGQKIARPVSLLLSVVSVCGVVALVIAVITPQLGKTFVTLKNNIEVFLPKAEKWIREVSDGNPEIMEWVTNLTSDWQKMLGSGFEIFKMGMGNILTSTISVAKGFMSFFTNFFIAFVFALYILLQKEKLSVQVKKVLFAFLKEKHAEKVLKISELTYNAFSSFITGQCLEAVILGSMFVIAMWVFRFPYALLIGVFIAFTALIPMFGAFIGCALGTFLIFMEDPVQALLFIILFLVLQQIEGNLIYPHVVGNSVGLPSIWVLAAVSIGGKLWGIPGMLIFIPMSSVIYALFREDVYDRLNKKSKKPNKQS